MPSLSVRTAILLVNLGSPDEPEPSALRRYLAEFLWDPRVVDLPRLPWWLILHGVILRTRPAKSAEKYARIWTDEGSPLKVHTEKQAKLLRGFLGARGRPEIDVSWAMRYGRPSIGGALDQLVAQGFERVLVLPLYPQYAHSTTASVMDAVAAWVAGSKSPMAVGVLPSFPEDEGYIGALAASVRKHWQTQGRAVDDDRFLLMSFHGIPRKVAQRGDPYPQECERTARRLGASGKSVAADLSVAFWPGRVAAALHPADAGDAGGGREKNRGCDLPRFCFGLSGNPGRNCHGEQGGFSEGGRPGISLHPLSQ